MGQLVGLAANHLFLTGLSSGFGTPATTASVGFRMYQAVTLGYMGVSDA
jgi:hypothetical protein